MADYNKATNFTAKDSLPTGNSGKIVKGVEIDTELTAIASAIASKANINSPTFTGTPAAPTATTGSNTTQIASTAYVKQEITALSLANMSTQAKNAVDITGGTIVGITDLAVADGGTGASSLTGVVIGNGTSAMTAVAPGTSGNVLTSNGSAWTSATPTAVKGLGIAGEVWNDVTGSRAFGTTYTNNRSYPIMVSASTSNSGPSPYCAAYVGSVRVSYFLWQFNGSGAIGGTGPFIVPPGATYRIDANAGLSSWAELY